MIRVVGVGGVPGTGKSTLMKAVIGRLGAPLTVKGGLVAGTAYAGPKVFLMGKYEPGERYPGTDKLSMGVQPDAVKLIRAAASDPNFDGWTFLFEGDRLFNGKFIEASKALAPASIFVLLEAGESALSARRTERGDTMAFTFVQGRATKYANLASQCRRWRNETPNDLEANIGHLMEIING